MRRVILTLLAIVVLGLPALCRADELDERQNPEAYTDEDSQPLKIASYFVAPVGYVLEWTVARPLHYLMEDTFLAPATDSTYGEDGAPAPIAELPPPDYLPAHDPIPKFHTFREETLTPHTLASAPPVATQSEAPPPPVDIQPLPPPPPTTDFGSQPALTRP
jgi:hypothetical protein